MRFGLFGGPALSLQGEAESGPGPSAWDRFIDMVVEAEDRGYHSVFLTEHHFTGLGQVSSPLSLLSNIAGRTSRIRLGTAVAVLPWHNPLHLVEQANTVDLLSGGRLDLGIGRGYRQAEFDGFGIDFGEAQERYDEAVEVLTKAWTAQGRWSHSGRRWRYRDVVAEPLPVQSPHPPIWIASGSEPGIRAAARRGFGLLLDQFADFDEIGRRVAWYHDEAAVTGRDQEAPARIAVTRPLILADTAQDRRRALERRAELARAASARTGQSQQRESQRSTLAQATARDIGETTEAGGIIGPPQECLERLTRLHGVGANYVLLMVQEPEDVARFAAEVMPNLSGLRDA